MTKKKSKPVEQPAPVVDVPAPEPQAPIVDQLGPLPMGGASVAYVLPNGVVRPAVIVAVNADATVYLKVAVQPGDNARNPLPLPAVEYSGDKRPGSWHWPSE